MEQHGSIEVMTTTSTKSPSIDGRLIVLRPMRYEYLKMGLIEWLNDIEVVRYSNQRFIRHDIITCCSYLKEMSSSSSIYLGIFESNTLRFVGTITAAINEQHMTADLGILIGEKSVWGKGYGGEAFKLLSNYLLEEAKLRKLTCGTLACNHGMLKVIRNAGFSPDGVRKDQELIYGSPIDVHYFARFWDEKLPS